MTPRPSGAAHQVRDLELGLAEELGAAAGFEADERAQEHTHGRRGQSADALELRLARVRLEEGEQRPEIDRSSSSRPFWSA